ncbi:TetR/AcrR family transcriptional regulator [Clostridium sp.]|uniref:TetR/AcrR family transcriptional regulator n=1 Tax=Clostridium sp. TaxID=1506 RepID=UPI00284B2A27|nr:TetR/AcrR family transcriptional regulator [Clostridium sp.]MDR3598340.1 TetR/AcrR family transcriptional regulator [Clostridium sp.]
MKQKTNRIAEQSKKWLIEALFDLMKEKPYNNITVTEIADKAQLARRTFYRNFKVKEDLLSEYASYLFEDYIKCIKENTILTFSTLLITYFEFWNNHIKELELLKQNNLFYLIIQEANLFIPDLNRLIEAQWHNYENSIEERYICLFNVGGLWNVLSEWIEDKERRSPKEMAKIIQKAITNFSKAL